MQEITLEAEKREVAKKRDLKSLRAEGKIPAMFYGNKETNISLAVNEKNFGLILNSGFGKNILINLKFSDVTKTALIKEIHRDMISQRPLHIDFVSVSLKEKIEVNVHLHIIGIAPGVKLSGGVLEHIVREVHVSCLPTDIPKSMDVDISALELNHSIAVRDLPPIEGVEILTDPDAIIVNIVAPTVLEEAPVAVEGAVAAAGGAEPEVITKGKKDETAPVAADKKEKSK